MKIIDIGSWIVGEYTTVRHLDANNLPLRPIKLRGQCRSHLNSQLRYILQEPKLKYLLCYKFNKLHMFLVSKNEEKVAFQFWNT